MEPAEAQRRVYEVARDLGVPSRDVVQRARALGLAVKSHMSTLTAGEADRVSRSVHAQRRPEQRRRGRPAVIRRRRDRAGPPDPPQPIEPSREAGGDARAVEAPPDVSRGTGRAPAAPRPARPREDLPGARPPQREAPPSARPPQPARREPGRRRGPRPGRRPAAGTREEAKKPAPTAKAPAARKRVIRVEGGIPLTELSQEMGVKVGELLGTLWKLGLTSAHANTILDADVGQILASEYGYEVRDVSFREEEALAAAPDPPESLAPRPPVVTVMGHVDHGKTTLLDRIRRAHVAGAEAGGITQHIAAYRARAPDLGDVVFLDTPGHEAFAAMRARGAQTTDIAVLIVAADDGVMPQTLEALGHARAAGAALVVAVNKIDAADARPERVRSQLADHDVIPEEWGGETPFVDLSARTGEGVGDLVAALALRAEELGLRANPDKPAIGTVLEARVESGRGPVATILVREGTLREGDTLLAGEQYGRVRAMVGEAGHRARRAGPASVVEVSGLGGVPEAGASARQTDEETAKRAALERKERRRRAAESARTGRSLREVMQRLKARREHAFRAVVKADVHGSAEALAQALEGLATEEVRVEIVRAGVGGITESDVRLASASGAMIVGFRVRPLRSAADMAAREDVAIETYDVIYTALEDVTRAMEGLLEPVVSEHAIGELEVRDVFRVRGVGRVAGCVVTSGKLRRHGRARVLRDGARVFDGEVRSLRRYTEDVSEVEEGQECGVYLGFEGIRRGDHIEAYEVVEEARTLRG